MFARDFLPPNERVLDRQINKLSDTPQPHNILSSAIILGREIAKHYIEETANNRAAKKNINLHLTEAPVGTRCFLDISATKTSKFKNPFKGPMRIIRWMSPQNAMIQDINDPTSKTTIVHASKLKLEPNSPNIEYLIPQFTNHGSQTYSDHKGEPLNKHTATQISEETIPKFQDTPNNGTKKTTNTNSPNPTQTTTNNEPTPEKQPQHKWNLRKKPFVNYPK
jgi:hypothetical protein